MLILQLALLNTTGLPPLQNISLSEAKGGVPAPVLSTVLCRVRFRRPSSVSPAFPPRKYNTGCSFIFQLSSPLLYRLATVFFRPALNNQLRARVPGSCVSLSLVSVMHSLLTVLLGDEALPSDQPPNTVSCCLKFHTICHFNWEQARSIHSRTEAIKAESTKELTL